VQENQFPQRLCQFGRAFFCTCNKMTDPLAENNQSMKKTEKIPCVMQRKIVQVANYPLTVPLSCAILDKD
jgi:hypothetical protein